MDKPSEDAQDDSRIDSSSIVNSMHDSPNRIMITCAVISSSCEFGFWNLLTWALAPCSTLRSSVGLRKIGERLYPGLDGSVPSASEFCCGVPSSLFTNAKAAFHPDFSASMDYVTESESHWNPIYIALHPTSLSSVRYYLGILETTQRSQPLSLCYLTTLGPR